MKSVCAVLLALLCGCSSLRDSAHGATALDAATTAAGVASGAAVEVNPLIGSPAAFAGIMLARVIGVEVADGMDEPARTQTLAGLNSIWWGVGIFGQQPRRPGCRGNGRAGVVGVHRRPAGFCRSLRQGAPEQSPPQVHLHDAGLTRPITHP
jgi:hypothetical protein